MTEEEGPDLWWAHEIFLFFTALTLVLWPTQYPIQWVRGAV